MSSDCCFCGSTDSDRIRTTSRTKLLAEYRRMYGLCFPQPVLESNFAFSTLAVRRCRRCGTISYDPMIAGNAAYYEYLSRNVSFYWSDKRWEHPIAADMLAKEDPKLFLEVGCGAGHFLRLARSRGYKGHGCELNPQFVDTLRAEGFHVVSELDLDGTPYDALVMFQVLEHLIDPYSFLKSIVPHIRPGGLVIISTPVTPSCAALNANPFLLPPHHQWLPTVQAFHFLADRLGLVCETIICEPPNYGQVLYALRKWLRCLPYSRGLARYWARAARVTLRVSTLMQYEWAKVGHTGMAVLRTPARSHSLSPHIEERSVPIPSIR
jgi:SAM-dependent methyltransferase